MKEECLICGAPLVYLEEEQWMECAVCHKKVKSRACCEAGHFVCDTCHTSGMDQILAVCLKEKGRNPVEILEKMMSLPFCHMHGPEHHVMVAAALLTAYRNAGGDIDLEKALQQVQSRGMEVPGGACGFWGACGAGVSTGIYMSVITGATPLAGESWGMANQMTSRALASIGAHGGPRCCKRDSYLAVQEAVRFTKEHFNVTMEVGEIHCRRSGMNNQCIGAKCPFHQKKPRVAFLCVHNSCRSQMAEAFGKKYLSDICDCYSAGTETRPEINQDAVRLMKQIHDIDMEKEQYSKLLEEIPEPDIVVSMGCNVICPSMPGKVHMDWGLEDPTGQPDEVFLETMKRIEEKVLKLREFIAKQQNGTI